MVWKREKKAGTRMAKKCGQKNQKSLSMYTDRQRTTHMHVNLASFNMNLKHNQNRTKRKIKKSGTRAIQWQQPSHKTGETGQDGESRRYIKGPQICKNKKKKNEKLTKIIKKTKNKRKKIWKKGQEMWNCEVVQDRKIHILVYILLLLYIC